MCRRRHREMIHIPNTPEFEAQETIESIPIGSFSPALFRNEFQAKNKPLILNGAFGESSTFWEMSHLDVPNNALVDLCLKKINMHTGLRRKHSIDLGLYSSPHGHIDHLHLSGQDKTLVQFRGKSQIVLFPPSVAKHLYPIKRWQEKTAVYLSQIDMNKPDFEKFPTFQTALAALRILDLDAGQTLYIPMGWWCEIQSTTVEGTSTMHCAWKVDPFWRYSISPQAAYLCGVLAFLRLTR